jgi:hypothetical protein
MKAFTSRSALGRRVAATAVLGLAATSLTLGLAGPASAVTTIDLEGTVTGPDGGANVSVYVEDAATNGGDLSDSTVTDANGHYQFENLDFDGPVKIQFSDDDSFDLTTASYYLTRWYGGSKFETGATPVTLSTDGDTMVNMTMSRAAIVAGSVAVRADGHVPASWDIDLADADLDLNWNGYVNWDYDDPAGTFRIALEPGTYRFGGTGSDPGVTYLESWWTDADTVAAATPIPLVSGQTVTGVNMRLTDKLTARQAPSISGFAAVGKPLTVSPGTWSRNAGTEFSYSWKRGTTIVGSGATYTPTVADFGQKLTVLVTALNGEFTGQAAAVTSDTVKWASDAKGKAKRAGSHKVRFAMKIKSAHQSPVKGKVVVLRGTKKVHKPVKLVKGKVVITVAGQPKGKQTYTVLFKGNQKIAKSSKTFTVKVK